MSSASLRSASKAGVVACFATTCSVKRQPQPSPAHLISPSAASASRRCTCAEKHSSHAKWRAAPSHSSPCSSGAGQKHRQHVRSCSSSPSRAATSSAVGRSAGCGEIISPTSVASAASSTRRERSRRTRSKSERSAAARPSVRTSWRSRSSSPSQKSRSSSVTPSAKTSEAGEGRASGARYSSVPRVCVDVMLSRASRLRSKSQSAGVSLPSTTTFSGLRSRCSTPCAWRKRTASATRCAARSRASAGLPPHHCRRLPPT
mmetsp:Transcript_12889/g.32154  ORF Transcript_12889/g.32154 Transcript_12889/m.32154 type:complete len:260 (+) Transcript_12889:1164-1943(+)